MTDYPSKQLDQFVVRLPDGMRERIKAEAADNGRSMNAEIVATLELVYPEVERWDQQFADGMKAMREATKYSQIDAAEIALNKLIVQRQMPDDLLSSISFIASEARKRIGPPKVIED